MAKHVKTKRVPRNVMIRALVTKDLAEKLALFSSAPKISLGQLRRVRANYKLVLDAQAMNGFDQLTVRAVETVGQAQHGA